MLTPASPHCSASSASAPGRSGSVVRTLHSMRRACARRGCRSGSGTVSGVQRRCRSESLTARVDPAGAAPRRRTSTRAGRSRSPRRAAFLLRLPGLTRPIRADEAGFTLVGHGVGPAAGQRLRAVLRGPAAAADRARTARPTRSAGRCSSGSSARSACALLVVTAADVARLVADRGAPRAGPRSRSRRSPRNIAIDAVAVKGELLALPVLMGSLWLALLAVRDRVVAARARRRPAGRPGARLQAEPGRRPGLRRRRCSSAAPSPGGSARADLARLALAAAAGAALPVLGTVGWALVGRACDLDALWYAVYGFRVDAARGARGRRAESRDRAGSRCWSSARSARGMLLVIGGFVVHIRGEWEDDAPLDRRRGRAAASSTSPGWCSAAASGGTTCSRCAGHRAVRGAARPAARAGAASPMRAVIAAAAASTLPAAGRLGGATRRCGLQEFDEVDTGEALARGRRARRHARRLRRPGRPAAHQRHGVAVRPPLEPADAHPRPGARRPARLVAGPDAPTWLVEWVPFDAWSTRVRRRARAATSRSGTSSTAPAAASRTVQLRTVSAARRRAEPRRPSRSATAVTAEMTLTRPEDSAGQRSACSRWISGRGRGRGRPRRRAPPPRASRRSASRS